MVSQYQWATNHEKITEYTSSVASVEPLSFEICSYITLLDSSCMFAWMQQVGKKFCWYYADTVLWPSMLEHSSTSLPPIACKWIWVSKGCTLSLPLLCCGTRQASQNACLGIRLTCLTSGLMVNQWKVEKSHKRGNVKGELKLSCLHIMKAYTGNRGVAQLILNLGSR
jgi:hypothetical protein